MTARSWLMSMLATKPSAQGDDAHAARYSAYPGNAAKKRTARNTRRSFLLPWVSLVLLVPATFGCGLLSVTGWGIALALWLALTVLPWVPAWWLPRWGWNASLRQIAEPGRIPGGQAIYNAFSRGGDALFGVMGVGLLPYRAEMG